MSTLFHPLALHHLSSSSPSLLTPHSSTHSPSWQTIQGDPVANDRPPPRQDAGSENHRDLHTPVSLLVGGACYHGNTISITSCYIMILSLFSFDSFVGRKVELISQEKVLTELIGLIRGQRSLLWCNGNYVLRFYFVAVNLFPGSGGVPLRYSYILLFSLLNHPMMYL